MKLKSLRVVEMEDLKIRVRFKDEADSVILFLENNGYSRKYNNFTLHNGWVCFDDEMNILCVCNSQAEKELDDYKEITIDQLKDMVVLKRDQSLNEQYAEIEKVRQAESLPELKIDNVNHPKHYNKGRVECINAIQASMSKESFCGYLKGNIVKYMWRYEDKGGVE